MNRDLRITPDLPDGDVIFESATDQPMENHLTRPEIRQALRGLSRARSSVIPRTMGYETYYYAVQCPAGKHPARGAGRRNGVVGLRFEPCRHRAELRCLMLAAAILSTLLTRALVQSGS